jgi:hypothetical protein
LPEGLERRLLMPYLGVFVAVLAVFAVLTHVAFSAIFQSEIAQQLDAMLEIGESVADAGSSGLW